MSIQTKLLSFFSYFQSYEWCLNKISALSGAKICSIAHIEAKMVWMTSSLCWFPVQIESEFSKLTEWLTAFFVFPVGFSQSPSSFLCHSNEGLKLLSGWESWETQPPTNSRSLNCLTFKRMRVLTDGAMVERLGMYCIVECYYTYL